MNINPAAAASVAGTSHAAARGGESDQQATDATNQQAKSDRPGGASGESSVEAGDQTGDRDANGRQLYDTFEQNEADDQQDEPSTEETSPDEQVADELVTGERVTEEQVTGVGAIDRSDPDDDANALDFEV